MKKEAEKAEKVKLTEIQEKVLWLMKYYGTVTQSEEHRLELVARVIDQLYFELAEGTSMLKDFRFVKVVPS